MNENKLKQNDKNKGNCDDGFLLHPLTNKTFKSMCI